MNEKMDMNKFWATRRKILVHPKDECDTLDDEDNKPITSPTLAKTHVAGYYETCTKHEKGNHNTKSGQNRENAL